MRNGHDLTQVHDRTCQNLYGLQLLQECGLVTQEQETFALQKIKDSNIRQVPTAQYVQDVKQSMFF